MDGGVVRTKHFSKNCTSDIQRRKIATRKRAARAVGLFFLIQPIVVLICDVIAVAVMSVLNPLLGNFCSVDVNGKDNVIY